MMMLMLLLTMMMMTMMMMMILYNTNEESSYCPSRCVSVQLSTLAPHGSFKVAKVYFFKKQIMKPSFTPTENPRLSVFHHFSYTDICATFATLVSGWRLLYISLFYIWSGRDTLNAKQMHNLLNEQCDAYFVTSVQLSPHTLGPHGSILHL